MFRLSLLVSRDTCGCLLGVSLHMCMHVWLYCIHILYVFPHTIYPLKIICHSNLKLQLSSIENKEATPVLCVVLGAGIRNNGQEACVYFSTAIYCPHRNRLYVVVSHLAHQAQTNCSTNYQVIFS